MWYNVVGREGFAVKSIVILLVIAVALLAAALICLFVLFRRIREPKLSVRVRPVRDGAVLPVYGSSLAAGADLCACLTEAVQIAPGQTVMIPTGIAIELPAGWAGLIYARSGLASKKGLAPANKVGVVDADYRGEVMVALHNHGQQTQTVAPGDRIAQLVLAFAPQAAFVAADDLSETGRGAGGFGSTGR